MKIRIVIIATTLLGLRANAQITDTGGNVGIGTTNPDHKLDVVLSSIDRFKTYRYGSEITVNTSGGWARAYRIRNENDNTMVTFGSWGGSAYISTNVDPNSDPTGYNTGQKLTILKDGKVGIGTINPDALLTVRGTSTDNLLGRFETVSSSNKVKGIRINSKNSTGTTKYLDIAIDSENEQAGLSIGTSGSNLPIGRTNLDFAQIVLNRNGNVGIGTTDTKGFKLGVDGKIATEEVKVASFSNWSDFVFEKEYELPTLNEVELHIEKNGHLKDIPSAKEVKTDGFYLAEMDAKLLQKIEELTLYTIDQEKSIEEQNSKIETQQKEIDELKALVSKLLDEK